MVAEIDLEPSELREVTAYAARRAGEVIAIFERAVPSDMRPREAIAAAWIFARGGGRVKGLRDAAWAAHKAARESGDPAASEAARAAMSAPAAAFLHPLPRSTQVRHILGAAAHAARAAELAADDDPAVGSDLVEHAVRDATPALIDILSRYPSAPCGGGRTGELLRILDQKLRGSAAESGVI